MVEEQRNIALKDLAELKNLYVKKNFTAQQYDDLIKKESEEFADIETTVKVFSVSKIKIQKTIEHIYGNYTGFIAAMDREYTHQWEKCKRSVRGFVCEVFKVRDGHNSIDVFIEQLYGTSSREIATELLLTVFKAHTCNVLDHYTGEDPEKILEKVLMIDIRE